VARVPAAVASCAGVKDDDARRHGRRATAPLCPGSVPFAIRLLNAGVALVTFASALAVLVSDVFVAGYREHYHDALWFVALYAGVQAWMVVEFARGGRFMAAMAIARAAAAYLFLINFLSLWPRWMTWTPARYVYQLFTWGDASRIGLMVFVFLGRGAGNTLNLTYWTRERWMRLRVTRPLLGRAVTALPIMIAALCVWLFLQLVHEETTTYSADADVVARLVADGLDCAAVAGHAGTTTHDVRQRGDRRYDVAITWGCPLTRVVVRAQDGRIGAATSARPECCAGGDGEAGRGT
jgi:hypothetical protein